MSGALPESPFISGILFHLVFANPEYSHVLKISFLYDILLKFSCYTYHDVLHPTQKPLYPLKYRYKLYIIYIL